jgi:superfamily II DNA or RNA helicase
MAFKKAQPKRSVPDSPDELLRDLPRRKIPDVLPHQREIMRSYAETALEIPDVALQLPTGSGKTLVGLLIAEWRRRRNQERVVYLCTTRQLVNQVVEQAEEKYGLTVRGFTGRIKDYDPSAKADYRQWGARNSWRASGSRSANKAASGTRPRIELGRFVELENDPRQIRLAGL